MNKDFPVGCIHHRHGDILSFIPWSTVCRQIDYKGKTTKFQKILKICSVELFFYPEYCQFFAFTLARPDVTGHNPPGLILPDQGVMVRA
jgi:hypothetical protein